MILRQVERWLKHTCTQGPQVYESMETKLHVVNRPCSSSPTSDSKGSSPDHWGRLVPLPSSTHAYISPCRLCGSQGVCSKLTSEAPEGVSLMQTPSLRNKINNAKFDGCWKVSAQSGSAGSPGSERGKRFDLSFDSFSSPRNVALQKETSSRRWVDIPHQIYVVQPQHNER